MIFGVSTSTSTKTLQLRLKDKHAKVPDSPPPFQAAYGRFFYGCTLYVPHETLLYFLCVIYIFVHDFVIGRDNVPLWEAKLEGINRARLLSSRAFSGTAPLL